MPTSVQEKIDALSDAVLQVLHDMGDGLSCCNAAKADLRIQLEPFIIDGTNMEGVIDIDDACKIMRDLE